MPRRKGPGTSSSLDKNFGALSRATERANKYRATNKVVEHYKYLEEEDQKILGFFIELSKIAIPETKGIAIYNGKAYASIEFIKAYFAYHNSHLLPRLESLTRRKFLICYERLTIHYFKISKKTREQCEDLKPE